VFQPPDEIIKEIEVILVLASRSENHRYEGHDSLHSLPPAKVNKDRISCQPPDQGFFNRWVFEPPDKIIK